MNEYTLQSELWLSRPRAEVFPFFADARNLEVLTPPWLKFEVLTPAPIEMRPGTLIDYRITCSRPPHPLADRNHRMESAAPLS